MRVMLPAGAVTGLPPIVSVIAPSSTTTSASNGDVCSVSPCPCSKANSVTLLVPFFARTRLAMPCSA
jgi:hypothetical protein